MTEAKIFVRRYDPETKKSWISEYNVPVEGDTMVLDALVYIKNKIDRTLTFRYSCRMAICGSCGMVINGRPMLACQTKVAEIRTPIVVEPLYNFDVIKDLVVDMDVFMHYLKEMKPYIIRKEEPKEIIVKSEQQEPIINPSACINCMLCYAACPVFGYDQTFKGPAALSLLYRYLMDPIDQGREERLKIANDKDAVWKCSFWGECSNACPKNVDPAFNIQRMKLMLGLSSLK
ncbi:MAG TPA: succinate dehydrogenase/fumarate reductase iron-sulfur subunit [Geobacterales bacterium]|nr:succinate dehydrogenase/fumarate reductase iron-sulfur subunit [Geobacterales bacterium]